MSIRSVWKTLPKVFCKKCNKKFERYSHEKLCPSCCEKAMRKRKTKIQRQRISRAMKLSPVMNYGRTRRGNYDKSVKEILNSI